MIDPLAFETVVASLRELEELTTGIIRNLDNIAARDLNKDTLEELAETIGDIEQRAVGTNALAQWTEDIVDNLLTIEESPMGYRGSCSKDRTYPRQHFGDSRVWVRHRRSRSKN